MPRYSFFFEIGNGLYEAGVDDDGGRLTADDGRWEKFVVENFGKGFACEIVMGEVLVELFEALSVSCNTDIELLALAVAKVNASNWPDACVFASPDKFAHAGSVIDIGQCQ